MGAAISLLAYPYAAWPINVVLCSGGLVNILYSFGLGYSASMVSNGLLVLHRLGSQTPGLAYAQPSLSIMFGVRLFAFLWRRKSSPTYAPKVATITEKTHKMPLPARLSIVFSVGTLIAAYMAPLHFSTENELALQSDNDKRNARPRSMISYLGIGLAGLGLLIEAVADEQKHAFKSGGGGLIQSGLFAVVRHPNYSGEVLFHTGMLLSSMHAYTSWRQAILASLAPSAMSLVMFGATRGLDARQAEAYGAAFLQYKQATPWAVFPFIL